jgi:ferrous iron transport protein B
VRSLLDRTLFTAGRALLVAAPAGGILWILGNTSVLKIAASILEPIGTILGMNGVILLGFLFALPANELLIPVILMVLTGAGSLRTVGGDVAPVLMEAGWTWQTAVCTMVFTLFHWPCSTTLLTIYKETGSKRKTAAAFFLPTAVGIFLCAALNLIFQDFCV